MGRAEYGAASLGRPHNLYFRFNDRQRMTTSTWFWSILALLFGLNIGSFLNVVIWRIPRGGSLISPQFSYCPHCRRRLTAIDLVPLFSFLFLGCRCRTCKQPISWRYFTVELLTGLLFMALAIRFQHNAAEAVALMLFTALLVPMTFIDLDFFAIPDSLNALAFVFAIALDVWGIAHHEASHALLWGWMPRSIIGALAGILIFGFVRVAGWLWKRREAMGLGDVVLARAMGALLVQLVLPGQNIARLFPAWVLLSCLSGMVVGIPLIYLREKQQQLAGKQGDGEGETELNESDEEVEESSLREQLMEIGWVLSLGDFIGYFKSKLPGKGEIAEAEPEPTIEEEGFTPEPTAIPFGPFLAIGFLAAVLFGELLTSGYLSIAFPKK